MRRVLVVCYLLAAMLAGCTLGTPYEPGCHADAECGQGLVCRAGACFRLIGDPAPSSDGDAGIEGDGDTDD